MQYFAFGNPLIPRKKIHYRKIQIFDVRRL